MTYVSPYADEPRPTDVVALRQTATLGSYRRAVGWTDETRDLRGIDRSYLLFGH